MASPPLPAVPQWALADGSDVRGSETGSRISDPWAVSTSRCPGEVQSSRVWANFTRSF